MTPRRQERHLTNEIPTRRDDLGNILLIYLFRDRQMAVAANIPLIQRLQLTCALTYI